MRPCRPYYVHPCPWSGRTADAARYATESGALAYAQAVADGLRTEVLVHEGHPEELGSRSHAV